MNIYILIGLCAIMALIAVEQTVQAMKIGRFWNALLECKKELLQMKKGGRFGNTLSALRYREISHKIDALEAKWKEGMEPSPFKVEALLEPKQTNFDVHERIAETTETTNEHS